MKKCKFCGKEFISHSHGGKGYIPTYCSKKCKYADAYVQRICPTCGKAFRVNKFSTRRDFCSLSCFQREPCQLCGKIITGRNKYQGGERRYCSHRCANIVNRTLKAKASYWALGYAACLKRHGIIKCERCGFENIASLIIHHQDLNRNNNSLDNLFVWCANCHQAEHKKVGKSKEKEMLIAQFITKYV